MPSVEYNILLSPTYRVPVLYFFLRNLPSGSLSGLDAVHGLLVPEQMRSELQQVGVMGGISMSVRKHRPNHNDAMPLTSRGRTIPLPTCRHISFIHAILLTLCVTSPKATSSRRNFIYRYGSDWSEAASVCICQVSSSRKNCKTNDWTLLFLAVQER